MFTQSMENTVQSRIKTLNDERLQVQKKSFTKWINGTLKKENIHIEDIYVDLRDGIVLKKLLEVISGDKMPALTKGKMRIHCTENVEISLHFLRTKNIVLGNIAAQDIVDGNPNLILGLIWSIILRFCIENVTSDREKDKMTLKESLLNWCQRKTIGYKDINIKNFTESWKDGLAFNAILHNCRPEAVDFETLSKENSFENLNKAFEIAERELGVPQLLEAKDIVLDQMEEKSIMIYIGMLSIAFKNDCNSLSSLTEIKTQEREITIDTSKHRNEFKKFFQNIDKIDVVIKKIPNNMSPKFILKDKKILEIHICDGSENSLLHLLVQCIQPGICKQLIKAGAPIDAINDKGNTPLLELLSLDRQEIYENIDKVIEIVQLLINSGADINKKTATGLTVFQCASIYQNERLIMSLVTNEMSLTNISAKDFEMIIVENWHNCAESLIVQLDKNSLLAFISGDIIQFAMIHAPPRLVKLLLENSSGDVQQQVIEDILHKSAMKDDQYLFDSLKNVNICVPKLFKNGENLLTALIKSNQSKYCDKFLRSINAKSFVNMGNVRGQIPLQVAIEMRMFDIVENLIFETNNLNHEDNNGNTALEQLLVQISDNTNTINESRLLLMVKSIITQGGDIYKLNSKNHKLIEACKDLSMKSNVEDFFKRKQLHAKKTLIERVVEVEKKICVICVDREVDCALRCGHTFCMRCCEEFIRCPFCNAESTQARRIFLN